MWTIGTAGFDSSLLVNDIPHTIFDYNILFPNILWMTTVVISSAFVILDDIIYGFMIPTRID